MKKIFDHEIQRYNPSIENGLDEQAVLYMKEHGQDNKAKNPTNKSYFAIVIGNIFTFFNVLMFIIAAVLLIIVGPKVITNLLFLVIIVANILIGTIQECRSKHIIEKLKLLNDSKIKVRRNGVDNYIHAQDVVLDDVVILTAGDQIPADCIILEESVVEVNEALLTGESIPVKKSLGDTLFAGSFIVSGTVAARADKVGNNTYISSIENKAKLAKQPKSKLMIAINKVIKILAFIAIPLAFIVFVNEFLETLPRTTLPMFPRYWGDDSVITHAVFYGGTTIAYMVPAGMALLASVAMATGVAKLAQAKTLSQNLYSVELLSRVNTLCLDKTGTLTDGTMVLEETVILSSKIKEDELNVLMASYLTSFRSVNQTSTALLNKYGILEERSKMSLDEQQSSAILGGFTTKERFKLEDTIEFSSARKYSAVKFIDKGWYAMGAPEFLTDNEEILNRVKEYASHGLRVVLIAKVFDEIDENEKLPENKEILAMFVLRDNIRPEVKGTMLWFKENDVDIKVISGDNVGTVSYIAKQCGIDNYDKVFDMSKLTENDNLDEIVMNYSIFGRVTPDQKADIIAALKRHDRIVGVTGDGLNDLLAFKQADCSIALATGASATKNVANLILLDSNFANMKEAVYQGRRVVNNIQRSSSLFVMKDFLWLFITVLPILLGVPHMAQPTVMTLVNIFLTGFASLIISLEPDKTRVKGNFFKNVTERAIISAIYMFIPFFIITILVIVMVLINNGTFNIDAMQAMMETSIENHEIVSFGWLPVAALCITISGFIVFFDDCIPFTKFRKILFVSVVFIVLVVLYLIPEFFIISGTKMINPEEMVTVKDMIPYMISHLETNAVFGLYRTMTIEQIIFLAVYAVLAYPLYLFSKNILGKLVNRALFTTREFKDE